MFEIVNKYNEAGEVLVTGVFHNHKVLKGAAKEFDTAFDGKLSDLIRDGFIKTKKNELVCIPGFKDSGFKRIYIVGLGNQKNFDLKSARETFGTIAKLLQKDEVEQVAFDLDSFIGKEMNYENLSHVLGESVTMSTYRLDHYKQTSNKPTVDLEKVIVITEFEKEAVLKELKVGQVFGNGTNSARMLVNLPSNMLTATDLAEYAVSLAKKYNMEYEVLEKEEMEKLGMGALLAVNKGSTEPPKMIVLKYQGKDKWEDVIGLVGKGITYDTGGYSLKGREGLVGMKTDMGGAATVLGAMEVIGELKPKQNIVAVIPSTDNMISGDAYKPDDVIVSMNGKTIEIKNTDAEGRLALADAITYSKFHGADRIIDVATLTGGVIVALGSCTTGAMTNDEEFYSQVESATKKTNENIWQLPYFEEYKRMVRRSDVADLNNAPSREAHMIMGGAFLGEFVENTPWVHLDIAGTATSNEAHALGPKGATGAMVRTISRYVLDHQ